MVVLIIFSMLYITSIFITYLSYKWKFIPFWLTLSNSPSPQPQPLVTIYMISFPMSLFLFVFGICLVYNTRLVPVTQLSVQYFYAFKNDHFKKSSYNISPYRDST